MSISAALFKAECLKLMEQVARTGKPIIITKHGRAVAQLAPIPVAAKSQFGYMRNTVTFMEDVVQSIDVSWDALTANEEQSGGNSLNATRRNRRERPK
jgi:prevent-host-death family protein